MWGAWMGKVRLLNAKRAKCFKGHYQVWEHRNSRVMKGLVK